MTMGEAASPPEHVVEEIREAAEHDETKRGLLKLAEMDVLELTWDEETDDVRWTVTDLGVELCRNDEMADYVRAAARPGVGEQPV